MSIINKHFYYTILKYIIVERPEQRGWRGFIPKVNELHFYEQ